MSTTALTVVVVVALIAGLFTAAGVALFRRRLPEAALTTAAALAAAHLTFVAVAWEAAATSETLPGIASLPTGIYDAPAWAAVAFSVTGIVLATIERHRRKVAEKEMTAALMHFFGVNESKENESEED